MTGLSENQDQLEAIWLDPQTGGTPLERWQELASRAVDPNPFFSPSFLQPYLQAFPARSVKLLAIRHKTTETWFTAAPIGRRPAGLVIPAPSAWTSHFAPLGTPLLHPEAGAGAVRLFANAAAGTSHLLALPFLPRRTGFAKLAATLPDWSAHWPLIADRAGHGSGPPGQMQLETAFCGKRRKEMRRQMRRLADHGPVSVRHLSGPDVVNGFEEFLDLEARGWKGRAGTALFNQPETVRFAREMVANRAGQNGVRIDQLWTGNTLVAALVLLIEGDQVFSWKIAFDEAFARASPGSQIAIIALKENLATPEIAAADSLAIPGHPMIEALWRGRVEVGTLVMSAGLLGSALGKLAAGDLVLGQVLRKQARAMKARFGQGLDGAAVSKK